MVVNGAYIDATFTEGGDVGVVYSAEDPTIFGTVFNDFTIVNIPNMTVYRPMTDPARNGIYIDNSGSGVTVNNATFVNCASTAGFCVFMHGSQACTINGVTTINCASTPVWIQAIGSSPWTPPPNNSHLALLFFTQANANDPRYQTKYGPAWNQLISMDGGLGASRNIRVLRIFPLTGSTAQTDLNTLGLGVPVNQPQGAVAASGFPAPPYPPPSIS
jgi:hypothetical protein